MPAVIVDNSPLTEDCDVSDLSFQPVTVDSMELLKSFFERYPSRSCDFTVGGVLMWVDYFDYEFAVLEKTLIITGVHPESGEQIFYAPCGPMDFDRYMCVITEYCRRNHIEAFILDPYEAMPESIMTRHQEGTICANEWKEYLYDIDRFTTFAGRKMEKKRNHLNFFINNYSPFESERIDNAVISELISFTRAFDATHIDSKGLAAYECRQVVDVLRHYDEYPFFGITIRVAGTIAGYTFGEKCGDTFFVHVEKGNIAYRGIYQALASRLASEVKSRYADVIYLNREEDMGDESLRRSKESYHPSLFINKRILRLPI